MLFPRSSSGHPVTPYLLCAAVAALAGCAAGGSQAAPSGSVPPSAVLSSWRAPFESRMAAPSSFTDAAQSDSWISPAAKNVPLLYVAENTGNGFVNIYPQDGINQAPLGKISGLAYPVGLFVDKLGRLYVANSNDFNVPIYKRGAKTPFKTLNDPGEYPYDVTEDSAGTIYVSSAITTSHTPGNVAVYAHGSVNPTSTLSDPKWFSASGLATDSSNNLYVCYDTTPSGGTYGIDEFLAGSTTPIDLGLSVSGCSTGLRVDNHQRLVITDSFAPGVDIFPQGAKTPSKVFGKTGEPIGLSLNGTSKDVYVTNYANATVEEYSYPAGKLVNTITKGLTVNSAGVATDPAAAN